MKESDIHRKHLFSEIRFLFVPLTRRAILRVTLSIGSIGVAGCTSNSDGRAPGTDSATETATTTDKSTAEETTTMPKKIRFWLKEVSLSDSERDDVDPIPCSEVSEKEQEIIQTAIESEEYTSQIGSESQALDRLRDRISEQNPGGLEVYLKCRETYYRVGFVDGDHIMAHPDH